MLFVRKWFHEEKKQRRGGSEECNLRGSDSMPALIISAGAITLPINTTPPHKQLALCRTSQKSSLLHKLALPIFQQLSSFPPTTLHQHAREKGKRRQNVVHMRVSTGQAIEVHGRGKRGRFGKVRGGLTLRDGGSGEKKDSRVLENAVFIGCLAALSRPGSIQDWLPPRRFVSIPLSNYFIGA